MKVGMALVMALVLCVEVAAEAQAVVIRSERLDTCDKIVSLVSTAGSGLTATIPGEAGRFHYFCEIRVLEYATATVGGLPTPFTVSTTNLPGNLEMTFATGPAVGTFDIRTFTFPLKSSVLGSATTIVAPAQPNILWRINVFYRTAP